MLDTANYGTHSFFIGMRQEMELDSGNYYIHLIHTMDGSTTFYMRVTPDQAGTVYTQKIQPGSIVSG